MKSKQLTHSLLLLLTAFIWGVAFVAQSTGGDAIGPYSFNGIRSLIGAGVLIIVIKALDATGKSQKKPVTKQDKKNLLIGGVCCGLVLCFATNVQQLGLYFGASAGKAGFLTACYILLVPILGLFLKKKCGWNIWLGTFIALIGLYLLCMNGELTFTLPDILLLLCALAFSIHILVIDHFSPLVDGVRMSCIQFFVCGVVTMIPTFFIDMKHSIDGISEWSKAFTTLDAWIPLLYAGVLSCGVAYTLQIVAQDGLNPTVASLLMSFESVFSVIAGWIILGQKMGARELGGCALIFIAVILAQIPFGSRDSSLDNEKATSNS